MSERDALPSLGPGAQAVRLAFRFVAAVAVLAACAWGCSNVRRIPADSRIVVMRFGAFVRTQEAGLSIAWPRPFETALLVPGNANVLALPIQALERDPRARAIDQVMTDASPGAPPAAGNQLDGNTSSNLDEAHAPRAGIGLLSDALAGSGYVLTGDNGVVQLSATLYYRVVDPYRYVLQRDRLDAALQRIVSASAVDVASTRGLDAILVARPEQRGADQAMALKRDQLRADLAHAIEHRLGELERRHAGLGVEVVRVDLQSAFPAAAVGAFNSVSASLQQAEQEIAQARTFAEKRRQDAQQSADRLLDDARASAAERLAQAHASTAVIEQLEPTLQAHGDPGLVQRLYRDRMQPILSRARVTTIDPRDTSDLILPGNNR